MNAEGEGPLPADITTVFPVPPPFYRLFTQTNIDRLQELNTSIRNAEPEDSANRAAIQDLPAELRTLIPPAPPTEGRYKLYGEQIGAPPQTLADLQVDQLVPSDFPLQPATTVSVQSLSDGRWTRDRAYHLTKLTRSMMLNYLELVGVMSVDPKNGWEKMKDLQTLFYNAHQLINEYRPHQARYALLNAMEDRLSKLQQEIDGVKESGEKVDDLLADLNTQGGGSLTPPKIEGKHESIAVHNKRRERQRAAWTALEAEMAA